VAAETKLNEQEALGSRRQPAVQRVEALVQRTRSPRLSAAPPRRRENDQPAAVPAQAAQVSLGRDRGEARLPSTILARPDARVGIYDALRHLQSRILASLPSDGHAVIAVCSALEGEGKTTVAVSLAEMLSDQFSRQTLLVDANLNHPQVHSMLETHASPGLKDCLSAGSVITSAIEWTGRLWVMPAGADPTVLSENPEDPRELFRTLRALFRLTIVDMPAVSAHQSAALMPRWADAVVWVVKADHSPADVVADSMDLVGRDKILGVVLNGHRSKLPAWLDRLL
jgi:non-specific protein-tyrosine kinase